MKHTQQTTIQVEEVVAITCDACKTTYSDPIEMQGFFHLLKTCGYGSRFGDGTRIECDLCQHCLHTQLGAFLTITPAECRA